MLLVSHRPSSWPIRSGPSPSRPFLCPPSSPSSVSYFPPPRLVSGSCFCVLPSPRLSRLLWPTLPYDTLYVVCTAIIKPHCVSDHVPQWPTFGPGIVKSSQVVCSCLLELSHISFRVCGKLIALVRTWYLMRPSKGICLFSIGSFSLSSVPRHRWVPVAKFELSSRSQWGSGSMLIFDKW